MRERFYRVVDKPLRVLLVEDSEDDALLLLRQLRRGGYEPIYERVDTPEEMERALKEAAERGEPWEIILSDYYMPRFSGPDALMLLKRLGYEDMPFIVVSGKVGEETAVEMMRAGAQDYVTKENMVRFNPAIERELREARSRRERLQAQEALHQSEERFRATFEQAAMGISHVSPDGRWLRVNQTLCEIVGYDREELFEMSFRDITHPDDLSRDLEHVRRMLDGETDTYSVEKRYLRKDGTFVWIELTTSLLRDPSGEPKYFISVTEDITLRKRAEEELRRSESSLADAQRMTHIGNWEYDVAGDKAYWSDELYRIFGFALQEFVPTYKKFLDSIHPDDRRLVRREVREALYGAGASGVEYRIVRPDGEIRVVSTRYRTVRDSSNRPVKLVGTIQDITERKWTERELESRARQQDAVARLGQQALSEPNLDSFMDRAVKLTAEVLGVEYCKVLELLPDGKALLLRAGVGWRDGLVGEATVSTGLNSQAGYTLVSSVPVIVENLREESRFSGPPLLREHGVVSGMSVVMRYRAVVEQAGEGIFLFDADTKQILETNPAFREMFGYTSEELGQMKLYDLIPHDPEGVDRNVERALAQGHLLVGERQYRRKDGSTVDVEVSGSVISYGGKRIICSIVRDITERKRAERALQEIREAGRNRMARDLHDGVLQDLSYASIEAQVVRAISEEQEAGTRLDQVIEALQRAGRGLRSAVYNLRSGEEQDRPFSRLLESLIEQSRRMASGGEIRLEIAEGFPAASLGERGAEVLRIVQEALTNARRHSGAEHILVALRMEGDKLVAEVSDDGRGFGPDTAMGVGLKSMKERTAILDADLEIESEPGKGARVRLRSPL